MAPGELQNGEPSQNASFNEAVESIYDAALNPADWPAALAAIAATIGALGALLVLTRQAGDAHELVAAGGYDDEFVRRYADHHVMHDFRLASLVAHAGDGIVTDDIASSAGSRPNDPVSRFLADSGCRHSIAVVLHEANGEKLVLLAHRAAADGAHDIRAVDTFEAFARHARRALDVAQLKSLSLARQRWFQSVTDMLPMGVILVAADMRVVTANKWAKQMMQVGDGILIRDGCLAAAEAGEKARLEQMVIRIVAMAGGTPAPQSGMVLKRSARASPLQLLSFPVPGPAAIGVGDDAVLVAIIVGDTEYEYEASQTIIGALYGLTSAEARLVSGLITGLRIRELAESFGISEQTVRTQLKRVMQKVGAGRQSELMKMLLAGPSLFTCVPTTGPEP